MRSSDWSSDVCSSDLHPCGHIAKWREVEQRRALDRRQEAVGHEFGMTLPGEMEVADPRREEAVAGLESGKTVGQEGDALLGLLHVDQQHELQGKGRRIEPGQAANMHLDRKSVV